MWLGKVHDGVGLLKFLVRMPMLQVAAHGFKACLAQNFDVHVRSVGHNVLHHQVGQPGKVPHGEGRVCLLGQHFLNAEVNN